ncbi:MAG TPA: apolipoprotein N-acyltransferase [Gammaproteobacteria bacterium]|nr:apolipoprotein N-acyltransferase [Gammaproteobacteria bacterium]
MLNIKHRLFVMALLAGAMLPGAFAPHRLWPLAVFSPAILQWVWLQHKTPKAAFISGLGYGLGVFGVGISWVFVSIHRYGNTHISLAVLITALLVIVLALFIATQGYVLKRFFRGNTTAFCLLGFPSCWVLFEWLRSWLFTGFPWLYLGYSQLETPLSGYAPIMSVYAVSTAVLLTSGALIVLLMGSRKIKAVGSFLIIVIWGIGYLFQHHDFTKPDPKLYTARLVQGNIKPFDKFTSLDPIGSTEKTYGKLTEKEWGADLILWPESAVPLPLPYSKPYFDELEKRALSHHSTLITGLQVINSKEEYHNSLIALGEGNGIYHKYHLVPFGDFLPLDSWLRGLIGFFDLPMSSFTSGSAQQPLITAGDLKLVPLICYEIAFPELLRDAIRNADAIITLSEDGWFGESWGPYQHLEIAQMRALETGRMVLRATTSGITAIIDPKGKLSATIPQFEARVLSGTFQSMTGTTPWVKVGLWPLLTLLFGCFILPGRLLCCTLRK